MMLQGVCSHTWSFAKGMVRLQFVKELVAQGQRNCIGQTDSLSALFEKRMSADCGCSCSH